MSILRIHAVVLTALMAAAPFAHAAPEGGPAPEGMPHQEAPRDGMPMPGGPVHGAAMMPGMMGGMPPMMGVELSESQQDKLFALHHQQAPAIYAQQKAARKAADALRELIGSAAYTPAKAKDLAQAAAKAHAELTLMRAQAEHEFLSLLTDEQKKQMAERRGPEGGKRGGLPMPGPRGEEGSRERR